MATIKYERYGVPVPPEDPDQDVMTVQETAYVLKCSVSWLRRFLRDKPHLHGRNGMRGRITTNREQRIAIHAARSLGDPRTGRTMPRQRRRAAKPALAGR
ncbi:DNA-binding protein [Streptomyces sp. NPDC020801]|uniref:DNA-binding protein n=1 Tax=Streptomyces sp. NPDC020801 TaxID=3365093 RepID=UPI00379A3A07